MNKYTYILFFTLLGFFINPVVGYACGSKSAPTEKTCCSKSKVSDSCEKACSDKDSKNSCDGSCKATDCQVTPVYSSIVATIHYWIPQNTATISSKETNFFYLEKRTTLNYFAIWSPPKIG